MIKRFIFILFLVSNQPLLAIPKDSILALQLKKYNERIDNWIDKGYNASVFDQGLYGDGLSYVLESFLTMYDITGDRRYIDRFIEMAIQMQENRNDQRGISTEPKWVSTVSMYQDGLICWPIAHLIYNFSTLESYQSLANQSFSRKSNTFNDNVFQQQFTDYKSAVAWLNLRILETMNFYVYGTDGNNGYWANNTKCFTPSTNSNNRAQQLNMQSAFGASLFYLGAANQLSDYTEKASYIAQAFKGFQEVSVPTFFGCTFSKKTYRPVFELTHDNAYIWRGSGWRAENCRDNIRQNDDFEDISHAGQTLIFPLAIVNKLVNNGNTFYTSIDFERFRNTFVNYVVKDPSNTCPTFFLGVDGDDLINYNSGYTVGSLDIRCMAFAPFTAYEPKNAPVKALDILNNYFLCSILPNVSQIATGMDLYTLALLMKENHKKNKRP